MHVSSIRYNKHHSRFLQKMYKSTVVLLHEIHIIQDLIALVDLKGRRFIPFNLTFTEHF